MENLFPKPPATYIMETPKPLTEARIITTATACITTWKALCEI
jgi:hypothetical protein